MENTRSNTAPPRAKPPELRVTVLALGRPWLEVWDYPNLTSPFWRLCWAETPGAKIVPIRDGRNSPPVAMDPRQMYVIPPHYAYAGRQTRPHRQSFMHFQISWTCEPGSTGLIAFPASKTLKRAFVTAANLDAAGGGPALALITHELAVAALQKVPAVAFRQRVTDPRIRRVLQRMRDQPGRAWPNHILAREAALSGNAFIRRFREIVGVTPQSHLTRLRIDHACSLLIGSEMKIDDVAEAAGFCNRYYFSTVFRRLQGVGPAGFRAIFRLSPRQSSR